MKTCLAPVISAAVVALAAMACSPVPASIRIEKDKYILEGEGAVDQIKATALDADGKPITEGVEFTFMCESNKVVRVTPEGALKAVSSGEDVVEVELVGTELKSRVTVRVKIPSAIETSHEKLSLWIGQVKENVSAKVVSEKGAFIEGYLPEWSSDDPSIVSVERIPDPVKNPGKELSYVKMVGLKSGDTYIAASFQGLRKEIRVRVYAEDENINLAGQRLDKNGNPIAEPESEEE